MKLINLFEEEFDDYVEARVDQFDIFDVPLGRHVRHTRDEFISATKKNLTIDMRTEDDWYIYIITDIPPISIQKFHQLVELSFHKKIDCDGRGCLYQGYFGISQIDHNERDQFRQHEIMDPKFSQWGTKYDDFDIMKSSWKEFVSWIEGYYQDIVVGHDDFAE